MKYRKKDEELRNEIAVILKRGNLPVESAEQLSGWDPYDQNGVSPFFDPEWMFDIKDGFDVVIGNPPYMRIQGIHSSSEDQIKFFKSNYKSATGRFDLYCLFTEKGYNLLSENGILNYIMPHKWTNASFGKGLRSFISNKKALKQLISFSEFQVFSASTYTSLIWISKKTLNFFKYVELNENLETESALNNWISNLTESCFSKINSDMGSHAWQLIPNELKNIFEYLNKMDKLSDITEGIFQGIVSGDNKVFILKIISEDDEYLLCHSESLDETIKIEKQAVKLLISGKDISRYHLTSINNVILYPYENVEGKTLLIPERTFEKNHPLAYKYLKKNYGRLSTRGTKNMKYPSWYSLWNQRSIERLSKRNKIITPDVCYGPKMWLDDKFGYFHLDTSYSIIPKESFIHLIQSIYFILNSSLCWFFLKNTGAVLRGGFFRFKSNYLNNFPIPKIEGLKKLQAIAASLSLIISFAHYLNKQFFIICLTIIDALVVELYFPDHMQALKIDIRQFVEKDIEEVMQNMRFETLNNTQKEQIVTELHTRWSDPSSEIVKRMNSFSEKSPEVLKPILEG